MSSLSSVTLSTSNDFTTIPNNAFKSCIELSSITIPSNIKTIDSNA
ncbi:MAG: leucine-rich repeat protein, partial [Bacteroidaceae bacterium]|nr:leucine-rich repeat protein [Bacteroidaceae bacterium]